MDLWETGKNGHIWLIIIPIWISYVYKMINWYFDNLGQILSLLVLKRWHTHGGAYLAEKLSYLADSLGMFS